MSYRSKKEELVVVRTTDTEGRAEWRVVNTLDGKFVVEKNIARNWRGDRTCWRAVESFNTRAAALRWLAEEPVK